MILYVLVTDLYEPFRLQQHPLYSTRLLRTRLIPLQQLQHLVFHKPPQAFLINPVQFIH